MYFSSPRPTYKGRSHAISPRTTLAPLTGQFRNVRKKLTKKLASKFQKRVKKIQAKATASFEDVTCAVCCMVYKRALMLQPCRHSFCNPCISAWMQKKASCPMCREEVMSFSNDDRLQNKTDTICESVNLISKRLALGIDRTPEKSSCIARDGMTVNQFLDLVPNSAAAQSRRSAVRDVFEDEIMRIEIRLRQLREEQETIMSRRRRNIARVQRQFETELSRLDREEELLNSELDLYLDMSSRHLAPFLTLDHDDIV